MHDLQAIIKQSPPIDVSQSYDASALKGRVILITGGANGLGSHMVRHWASHGAHVFIGDIDDTAGQSLVASLRSQYPSQTFHYKPCNVTVWEDQVALFDDTVRQSPTGGIDVVVPNAGILIAGDANHFEHPSLDKNGVLTKPNTRILDVNITGASYTTHLALHHLPRNRSAPETVILLVGSLASIAPLPGQAFYAMSKHAIMGLFRSLRATTFPHKGLRVNMIAPYYVGQTNMCTPILEAALIAGSAGPARIDDVVDAATRLIADPAVSGRALVVGPRLRTAPEGLPPVQPHEGSGEGRAAWECYDYDYDQVESFRWRYIKILNYIEAGRGYLGYFSDIWNIMWRK